jgi:COMPASS component SWD3
MCFLFGLNRQEFLELIQTQQTQRALAFLNKRLKPLETHLKERDGVEVEEGEFAELCYLLTCRSVRDSRLFASWPGPLRGREMLGEEIVAMARLEDDQFGAWGETDETSKVEGGLMAIAKDGANPLHHLKGEGRREEMPPDRLVKLLQQAVSFQVEFSRYRNTAAEGKSPILVTSLASDFECLAPPTTTREILHGHQAGVKCLTFIGDQGARIASGGSDGKIFLWTTDEQYDESFTQPQTRQPLFELGKHNARVK